MCLSIFYLKIAVLSIWIASDYSSGVSALRCYICGGNTGRPCEDIRETRRRSPYVRPDPLPSADGHKQWEVCNDLINNKGCIKQVVNNVVLLRACWMEASQRCLEDGDAQVCTCNEDLCNSSIRLYSPSVISVLTSIITSLYLIFRTFDLVPS